MEIAGQRGILVTGGYYNGVSSMFLPLEDRGGRSLETFGSERNMPRWEYVGGLTKVNLKILIFKIIFIDCTPSFRFLNLPSLANFYPITGLSTYYHYYDLLAICQLFYDLDFFWTRYFLSKSLGNFFLKIFN